MISSIGPGSSARMIDAASAMTVYCAQHLKGAFRDRFITFSSRPELVDLSSCKTLADKINLLNTYDDCSNTDLMATFDLILSAAMARNLSQEEIPRYLMILSDMEFDDAIGVYDWDSEESNRDTLFDQIRKKWEMAGYELPTLVFWQLNGRRTIYPEIDAKNGVIFLSGYSTTELEQVMAGEYENVVEIDGKEETIILSPEEQLALKLSNPRYDAVEAAIIRGIARESA